MGSVCRHMHPSVQAYSGNCRGSSLSCRTSQFSRYFLIPYVRALNGLTDAVLEPGLLGGFKGTVSCFCFPELFFCGVCVCGVATAICNTYFHSTPTAYFNNNNNNNKSLCTHRIIEAVT